MSFIKNKIFSDDIDIGINKPLDYPYMKFVRRSMLNLNSWPSKELQEKVPRTRLIHGVAMVCLALLYLIGGAVYLRINWNILSFFDKGHVYISLLMTFVVFIRIVSLTDAPKCKEVIKLFLHKMHIFYYKDGSEYAMKTHKQIHVISNVFTIWIVGQTVLGILGFNLIPFYRNYLSGKFKTKKLYNTTYEQAVYVQLPFDCFTRLEGYMVSVVLDWLATYLCSTWFVVWDLMLSLIVFHVWAHYKILLNDLDSFPLPAKKEIVHVKNGTANAEMYSKDELKTISKKLGNCVDYHRMIADYTNKISDAFGPMLFVSYAFHQTSGCLLLLECSQMTAEALLLYGALTAVLFQQLIQMSVIFELIGSTTERLKDGVYGLPWEYMDVSNRKTVAIFLINVQEPVHVKAMGIANVGVTSMAAILKTSFSYFAFLRTFPSE